MRLNFKHLGRIAAALAVAPSLSCSQAGFSRDQASYDALEHNYGGAPICDPLGNQGGAGVRQGLIGNVLYVSAIKRPTAATINHYYAFLASATRAPGTVYMSQVNAPTQSWTAGFRLSDGTLLTDPSTNEPLHEYFGLNLQSVIRLSDQDAEGYYQFVTISDDGALLTSGATVLAGKADALHSTRADCGATTVRLTRDSSLPINLVYFQAPRDAIAAVVAWRRLSSAQIPDQVGCGQVVPWDFFKSGTPNAFEAMQGVGWRIIPPANFVLPADAPANQCR